MTDPMVGFLNVDLDLEADEDLSALTEAMAPTAFVLHADFSKDGSFARLELEQQPDDADCAIMAFTSLIDRLGFNYQLIWRRARARRFSIGIQAPVEHGPYELELRPETLDAAARLGATVVVTVYGGTTVVH